MTISSLHPFANARLCIRKIDTLGFYSYYSPMFFFFYIWVLILKKPFSEGAQIRNISKVQFSLIFKEFDLVLESCGK